MKKTNTLQISTPTPSEAACNELIIADGGAADIRELLHGSPLPTLLLHGASEPLLAITNALQDSPRDTLHLVAHGQQLCVLCPGCCAKCPKTVCKLVIRICVLLRSIFEVILQHLQGVFYLPQNWNLLFYCHHSHQQ